MATRLSGQTSIFGVIFFVFKSLLGIERQKKLRKVTFFTRKPRSHVRILIYRTSPIHQDRWEEFTCLHNCIPPVTTFLGTTCPEYNLFQFD